MNLSIRCIKLHINTITYSYKYFINNFSHNTIIFIQYNINKKNFLFLFEFELMSRKIKNVSL